MNDQILYKDSVIEVKILTDQENESLKSIALRYVKPENYKGKDRQEICVTNAMGGETDWFVLPYTFGATIGKKLFEQFNAGLYGFDTREVENLKNWLIDMEIIDDAMCY
ncbi:MAG: hypothetical protein CVU05_15770 [Bacteroidetes bacterium HGW-Bacteroidetes-21]|jgi:hypothetical protein|nr:MAG: hypothetical protein CVU05_15770 [Bacteroidetes bacterium HGW-Bacteroidetes-21]